MARWGWTSVSTGVSSQPVLKAPHPGPGMAVTRRRVVLLAGILPAVFAAAAGGQDAAGRPEDPLSQRVDSVVVRWADGSTEPVPDEVSRLISVRPGTRFRPLVARQSVKQVFALGRFRDVRVRSEEAANGDLRLIFELDPIPRIARLSVEGAPAGEDLNLVATLGLEVGESVPDDLPVRAETGENWLRSRGYVSAEVNIQSVPEGRDALLVVMVAATERARVASIEVLGVDDELGRDLISALGISPDDPWIETDVTGRLPEVEERLRDRGFLFATATLDWRPTDTGDVQVVVSVDPGPEVGLEVQGFGASQGDAEGVVDGLSAQTLTLDAIEAARQELLDELRREGRRDGAVTVESVESADGGHRTFVFSADPGPRYVVGAVSSEGAPPEEADTVAEVLLPLRPGRPYREEEWQALTESVRRTLRGLGYFEAEVVPLPPEPGEPGDDGVSLDLRVRIEPGPLASVAAVRFEGSDAFTDAELAEVAAMAPGAPYVAEEIVNAREDLEAFHRDRGYLEAVVEVEAPVDPATHEAEVVFRIRPGSYFTVGGIIVAGLGTTRDSVIRSRLPFAEGDALGSGDLLEVRRRLVSMGIFRSVDVNLLEPEEPISERNVLIRVVEGPRTSIGYGAGYSEREQVRGEGEWTRNNLFGMGHTLSLFGRFSLKGTRMVATYRGAESVEGEIPIFVSAFRESQDRESLDFIRSGIGVQVTRRILGRNVFLRYDLTTSELFDLKINPIQIDRNFADNLWLSAVSASVVTDTRDDPVDPRRGRFGIVDVEWSSALLRSRAPFLKGLAQQYLFFPVGEAIVLAVSGRLGLAWTLGADQPALVPITERFFAGGATSLRGYKLDRAGPLDPSGYPVGGNMLIVGNLEVRFPIVGSLRGAVFSDHGGVYSEVNSFRLPDLGHNVGAGLRWNTPLGPLRFDYGVRLGDIGDAPRGQWHFTIGHAF
ncbi:MAG: BamA/TamA family outer membrane protein [Acidobacteria bacterium]|nr:BamA/TamA family outer membrane protein [Acidobacteriota bacterium]MYA46068.1 BamA/TamA family outer membrane protein [Acidobacteriota bacterium]MYI38983.1 BamA/TamA family outer membrane protein [Acidobacteriota bacterium]